MDALIAVSFCYPQSPLYSNAAGIIPVVTALLGKGAALGATLAFMMSVGTVMKILKVLGSGCKRCEATADLVRAEAKKRGVEIDLEKITDYAAIAGYGIVSTPGLVIDGKVVHAGSLPKSEDVARWLTA
jgi:small redox-active disulfide protein 2